jgi:signal transduction histidine kinase
MKPLPSIRKRLTNTLLAWSVVSTVVVSGAVWLAAHEEVDELLDETLQAAAEVLSVPLQSTALLSAQPALEKITSPPSGGHFAWQVISYGTDNTAQVLRGSALAPPAPLQAVPLPGFGDTPTWRTYGIALGAQNRMLYVAQTRQERSEAQFEVALGAALASLAMALLAHLWLRATAHQELQPLQTLADKLEKYDALAPGASLGVPEREELRPVHVSIGTLTQGLVRRVAHERAFSAHAAHALRTPLAGIDAQLAVALRECPPHLSQRLQNVRTASGRLQRVVTALLSLFRSGVKVQRQTLVGDTWLPRVPLEGLTLQTRMSQPLHADPDLLEAALLNLLDNALRHGARSVVVSTPAANTVRLSDDGPGVSAQRRTQLQQALDIEDYANHTGLGLMLADMVARAHGGRLTLPVMDQGFAVEMRFS